MQNILVIGGLETKFHNFRILGPVFRNFLEGAGFKVTLSENLDMLLPENIKEFQTIICYTTGRELTSEQEKGLLNAIVSFPPETIGKTFIGIHCASCSFQKSSAYLRMLGGKFLTHPPLGEELSFQVIKPEHPTMQGVSNFSLVDELYLMEIYPPIEILIVCNYKGFDRPIVWTKPYGLGRVFYTALGHDKSQLSNPILQKMIINAVKWK
ncbi:MAG: ThuA domain-containing protein [Candidatus Hodarchaeota archaeon]